MRAGSIFAALICFLVSGPSGKALASEKSPGGSQAASAEPAKPAAASSWLESFVFSGDLQYRHETILEADSPERNRHRLRARAGFTARALEWADAVFQLASGSEKPTTSTQTLGESFSSKEVFISLAFADVHPKEVPGLRVFAGKMKNPFHRPLKSQLIWDSDVTPEGLATTLERAAGPFKFRGMGAGFWVVENMSEEDTWAAAVQCLADLQIPGAGAEVSMGAGMLHFENMKGRDPLVDPNSGFGNTLHSWVDSGGTGRRAYSFHYQILDAFIEGRFKLGKVTLCAFAHFAYNRKAPGDGHGTMAGFGADFPPGISFYVDWRTVEPDAVVGAFAESEFNEGSTDGRGFTAKLGWKPVKNVSISINFYDAVTNSTGDGRKRKFQVDFLLQF